MPNRKRRVEELHPAAAETRKRRAIPVVEEELTLGRRQVKTGSVRVEKRVLRQAETVDLPVVEQTVEVRRVPKKRVVQSVPAVRKVGTTLIIPVVEEELVVTKRLVLKEEIHLVTRSKTKRARRTVPVSRERARVIRFDAMGNVIEGSSEHGRAE